MAHRDPLNTTQDVIAKSGEWTTGPLPQPLEQIALKVFARQYAMAEWGNPDFSRERHDARRFTLQLRGEFQKLDRWTLGNAVEMCELGMGQLVAGDRGLFPAEKKTLRDYAESCIQDLFGLFMGDMRAKSSESWKHVPENEPDDSEIEVITPKKENVQ